MLMLRPPPHVSGNRLLARLPLDEYGRLSPRLQLVNLKFKQILYEAQAPIEHAYFPIRVVLSAVIFMENGNAIEVATTGSEGMVGLPALFRAETSLTHVFVQIPGDALQMRADTLKEEATREGPFRRLLISYQSAFLAQVSQGVACNGLHTITQRCCRWLLMTHDRVQGDSFLLTHELLAMMLGVRRASISEVLRPLQEQGLIGSRRGKIAILDRDRLEACCCECYRSVEDVFTRLLD
jgi:CRP-like cAMP-binding protein